MSKETIKVGKETYKVKELHEPWLDRVDDSLTERKQFETQVKVNRKFASGKQHLNVSPKDGRVVDVRRRNGVRMITTDVLTPFLNTASGRLFSNDYRSNFLVSQDYEEAELIARHLNDAFQWGWDNEWMGDQRILALLRLLTVDGTAGLRCRYDRRYGDVVGDVPYKNGRPILDPEEARKYAAQQYKSGKSANIRTLREGRVFWEILLFENLLWPKGYIDPIDFPWEGVVRPVPTQEIKKRYPEMSEDLVPDDDLESSSSLTAGLGFSSEEKITLTDRNLLYTIYVRPNSDFKEGRTLIFTKTHFLDMHESLPYSDHPRGPRSGMHFFRWQIVPGRFPGRAFIEPGIGPQMVRNKRETQIDSIIDRNMPRTYAEEQSVARPKTGEPMEIIEVRPGSPLPQTVQGTPPGQWMMEDIKMQDDNIEKAMGLRSIALGDAPHGVTAYSSLALLNENNNIKLDVIAQDFRLEMIEVAWDTMEAMRNWPKEKHVMIAGPSGQLRSFLFNSNEIPPNYLVRPPRGGNLPRGQAAELQKINDIWQASAGKLPLSWYVDSLNAGKAQQLPSEMSDVSAHKAELENWIMIATGENPPVSEQDDHVKHGSIHLRAQQEAEARVSVGDESAIPLVEVIKAHRQEHLTVAEGAAAQGTPPPPTGPTGGLGQALGGMMGGGGAGAPGNPLPTGGMNGPSAPPPGFPL